MQASIYWFASANQESVSQFQSDIDQWLNSRLNVAGRIAADLYIPLRG